MNDPREAQCDPTEKTLYKEPHDDHWGTWEDRLFICGKEPYKGIGISDGCNTYVRPLKEWHKLAEENAELLAAVRELREKLEKARTAFVLYELDVDDSPPYRHKKLMSEFDEVLSKTSKWEGR